MRAVYRNFRTLHRDRVRSDSDGSRSRDGTHVPCDDDELFAGGDRFRAMTLVRSEHERHAPLADARFPADQRTPSRRPHVTDEFRRVIPAERANEMHSIRAHASAFGLRALASLRMTPSWCRIEICNGGYVRVRSAMHRETKFSRLIFEKSRHTFACGRSERFLSHVEHHHGAACGLTAVVRPRTLRALLRHP